MSKPSTYQEFPPDVFADVPFTEFCLTIQDESGNLVPHFVELDDKPLRVELAGKPLIEQKPEPFSNFPVTLNPNFVRSKLKLTSIGLSPKGTEKGKTLYYNFSWKEGNKQFSQHVSFDEYRHIVVIERITLLQKRETV